MSTFSTEITTTLGTLLVSTLVYLFTTFIQQRTKKNNTLRLIGTVYGPVRYFIKLRYIGTVANVLFLTFMFLFILSLLLHFILGSDSSYLIKIIIFISFMSGMLLYYVYFNFLVKRDQIIRELIDESFAYSTVDIDSQTLRWKALYWGTLVLAERYFLLIFIAVVSITSALSFLNKGFTVLGAY